MCHNLHLTAYIHGKTMLSEYCICDQFKIYIEKKKSLDKQMLRKAQRIFLTLAYASIIVRI